MVVDKMAAIAFGAVGLVLAGLLVLAVIVGASAGRERDHHLKWAEDVCSLTGAPYRQADKRGKEAAYSKWGGNCREAVRALQKFKADVTTANASAIDDHQAEQQIKGSADQAQAQRSHDRTRKALQRMEAAENAVQDDNCVGGEWFAGLNDLGGLRGPVGAAPRAGCEGGPTEGNAAG